MAPVLLLSLLLACLAPASAYAQSAAPGGAALSGPRRAGGAVAPLQPIEPAAPPEHGIRAPAAPVPPPPLSTTPRFVLRAVRIEGNTVLDKAAIDGIVGRYLGKPVSLADLEAIRYALTLLYIDRGYLNSGVTIPDQKVTNGVVMMRAVEGRVAGVAVSGTRHFKPEFFSERLQQGLTQPFNIADLQREQQILLQDPLVRRLNIELLPGLAPGEATLHADVLEGSPYTVSAAIANNQSPAVVKVRGELQGSVANLWGVGDVLAAQYGRSDGINDGAVAYSIPLASDDTRLSLRYDVNSTLVVSPALSPLNVTSRYDSLAVGLSRPFYRTAEATLTLGGDFEWRRAQTFLLGMPFSFTAGSQDGKTNVTVLRLYGEWLDRDAEHALALRATLSFGLPALGATVTDVNPTGEFVSWLGQAQYVRRVYRDWDIVVRGDLQLANKPLFPIEQFALGGIDTVRGYRQYLTLTDDAFFASGELRIPVARLRVPYLSDTAEAGAVQIAPFYDFGRGWNIDRPTPYPADISGVGVGLRWLIGTGTTAELYYARPLRHVPVGTSLEDRGIYFRLTTRLY